MYEITQTFFKNAFTNGITQAQAPNPPVIKEGGINRPETSPLQGSNNSGINTGREESPRKIDKFSKRAIDKSHKKIRVRFETFKFKERPVLHTHRLDGIARVKTLDMEKAVRDLTLLLSLTDYKREEKEGEKYKTIILREERGETVVISHGKEENVYIIHLITHDIGRMEIFRGYLRDVLGIENYTLLIEAYVRYLDIYELKVEMAIKGLKRANTEGSPIRNDQMPRSGKLDNYLLRAVLEYKGVKAVVKSYRHASYKHYRITEAEFHPKLEQLTIIKDASTTTPVMEYYKEYNTLLYTIAYTLGLRVIEGDYEKTETTTFETTIDPYLKKAIRGMIRKIKAETLLEQQYPDKRLAIAKLLDMGMRPSEVADFFDYTRQWITQVIKELVDQGILIRVGRGQYKINPKYKPAKEERRVEEHHGDLKQFIEFLHHNKKNVVKVNTEGTPYIDVKQETEFGVIITRYLFTRIVVFRDYVKLRDGRYYDIRKWELDAMIKRILET